MQFFKYFACIFLPLFIMQTSHAADSHNRAPVKVMVVLTKIDSTDAQGLCFVIKKNVIALQSIGGYAAKYFSVQPNTVKIHPHLTETSKTVAGIRKYLSVKQTWNITDSLGAGVKVTNNNIRSLIIISKIERPVSLMCRSQTYTVPGHSFFLVNNPPISAKLDLGSGWTAYYGSYSQKMEPIDSPTIVEIMPNAEGISGGLPEIIEGTIADKIIDMGTS
jgi:hypothetical protein